MGREEFRLRAQWLAHWNGMVTRFEPTTGSTAGAPDTHIANPATAGFVEFKVVEAGGTFDLRPSQMLWHSRYSKMLLNSCICVLCQQGFWLIPSRMAVKEQIVVGEPLNWDQIKGILLTYAARHAFTGKVFNRDSIEHLIEPVVAGSGGNIGREEKIQGRLPCRGTGT